MLAASGSGLAPALPLVEGLRPIVATTTAQEAYAVYRMTSGRALRPRCEGRGGRHLHAAELTLPVTSTAEAWCDGSGMAALTAALGTSTGSPGYVLAADIDP